MARHARAFQDDLFALLRAHLPSDDPVLTLGANRPNWIVAVETDGLLVETERSRSTESGPQPVPAWMFDAAWQRLTSRGRLTHAELLSTDDLNVKRSSFVCAALACLPGVDIASTRPIVLTYAPQV